MTDDLGDIPYAEREPEGGCFDFWQPYFADYPGWHAWRGINQLYYARLLRSSPPIIVERAESPEDLADMIKREQARRSLGPYAWDAPMPTEAGGSSV
jgi:hypothetical protein